MDTMPAVSLTVPAGAGYSLGKVVGADGNLYTVVGGEIFVPASVASAFIAAGFAVA